MSTPFALYPTPFARNMLLIPSPGTPGASGTGPGAEFAKENGDAFFAVEVAVKRGPRPHTVPSFSEKIHQFLVDEHPDPVPVAEDYYDEYSNASGSDSEVEGPTN